MAVIDSFDYRLRQYELTRVNTDNKYLFVNIPKNASSSIKDTFHFNAYMKYSDIENIDSYFKFCIVRNPLSRIVSSYAEIRKCRHDGPFYLTQSMDWYKEGDLIKSFVLFIEELERSFYDIHAFPQIKFIKDKGLKPSDIDLIIDFDALDLLGNILHIMKSNTEIISMISKYVASDKKIQDKIIDLYSEDFDLYTKIKWL